MSTDLPIQMLEPPRIPRRYKRHGHENFLVSIPLELLEKVKCFAKVNHRSGTAEIVSRLEASFANQSIDEHGVIVHQVPSVHK